METQRSYEEFEPMCKWQQEEHQSILEVHLEGFKKDQLKIQVSSTGVLTITGKRPIDETKSTGFHKTVQVPKDCRKGGIHAKLSSGILKIIMPKKSLESEKRSHERDDDGSEEAKHQPATSTGVATLTRINARKCMTALRNSIRRTGADRITARRLGVAIGVVVAVTVGGFLAYKIRQSFHSF
ncbi:hypothetical protein Pint_20072 [Pistacia integerrima]|uniref:Uncharacterized protein n=2 Tax=Pistacia integerrima TaxID=434235 RepID=A0ACC0X9M2_9ROSI|nr:hypothetical protein Pint_20063 [Pistacia integerrima]KAJ0014517.1 hypothetical protein Pint_20072 [Pistacia integerrima]